MKSSIGNVTVIGNLVVTGVLLFSLLPAATYAESLADRRADSDPIEQWGRDHTTVNMKEIEHLEPTASGPAVGATEGASEGIAAEQQESMTVEQPEGEAMNVEEYKQPSL